MFGRVGRRWIDHYAELLSLCVKKWQLELQGSIDEGLPINQVIFATCPGHGDVVLKLGVPNPEQITERQALGFFNGALRSDGSLR